MTMIKNEPVATLARRLRVPERDVWTIADRLATHWGLLETYGTDLIPATCVTPGAAREIEEFIRYGSH